MVESGNRGAGAGGGRGGNGKQRPSRNGKARRTAMRQAGLEKTTGATAYCLSIFGKGVRMS